MRGALALIVPMLVFTGVIALLALMVLLVRLRLLQREPARLLINDRLQLDAMTGDTLLQILGSNGIQLPAACGGRGACGQCQVRIEGEIRPLLANEANHIQRAAAAQGTRLACMFKVTEDLRLHVAEDVLDAQRCECRVASVRNVSTYLRLLELALPADQSFEFAAGDYVLVEAPAGTVDFASIEVDEPYAQDWQQPALRRLRAVIEEPTQRAYSLANPPQLKGRLELVVRLALPPPGSGESVPPGLVSSFLFNVKPGDLVTVTGPFGEFHAGQGTNEMVFVGGGAGIAPLRAMIREQLIHRASSRRISFWYGARNLRELCFYDEFLELARRFPNFSYHVALSGPDIEPEWQGDRGFIHNALLTGYLDDHPAPEAAEYYLCGPPLMSSATLAMLEDLGVDRASVHFDDFGSG